MCAATTLRFASTETFRESLTSPARLSRFEALYGRVAGRGSLAVAAQSLPFVDPQDWESKLNARRRHGHARTTGRETMELGVLVLDGIDWRDALWPAGLSYADTRAESARA